MTNILLKVCHSLFYLKSVIGNIVNMARTLSERARKRLLVVFRNAIISCVNIALTLLTK